MHRNCCIPSGALLSHEQNAEVLACPRPQASADEAAFRSSVNDCCLISISVCNQLPRAGLQSGNAPLRHQKEGEGQEMRPECGHADLLEVAGV